MKPEWLEYRQKLNERIREGEFFEKPYGPLIAAIDDNQRAEINMQTRLLHHRIAMFDLFDGKHLNAGQFDTFFKSLSQENYLLTYENLATWGFAGRHTNQLEVLPLSDPQRFEGATEQVARLVSHFADLGPKTDNISRISIRGLTLAAGLIDDPEAISRIAMDNKEELSEKAQQFFNQLISTAHRIGIDDDPSEFIRRIRFHQLLDEALDNGSISFNRQRLSRIKDTLTSIGRESFELENPDVIEVLNGEVESHALKLASWMKLQKGLDSLKPFGSAASNKNCDEVPASMFDTAQLMRILLPDSPATKTLLSSMALQLINNRNKYTDKDICQSFYMYFLNDIDWTEINTSLTRKGKEHLLKTNLPSHLYSENMSMIDKGRAISNDFGL